MMITQYVNHKNVGMLLIILSIVFGGQVIGFAEVTPVSDRTSQVRDAIVSAVPNVNAASDVTETHLAAITRLNLRSKGITALKSGDFSGLSGLTDLNLYGNQLSSLPDGIFEGLTALTELRLGGNTTNPMLLTVSLEKVGDNQFKAVASIGAPFAIVLPVSATNGSISGDATTLTISKGSVESDAVTVTRTEGTTAAVTVNIGTLPAIPNDHYGYSLSKSDALPVEVISAESTPTIPSGADEIDTATPAITPPPVTPVTPDPPDEVPENNAPTFTEGAITKRSVAENTAANTNIGTAVSATDSDSGDILSYTLGVDAASFDIDSATGQLKTKAALDYETKRVYAVSITVSDGSLRDTISVIISVINKADTVLDTSILSVNDRTSQVRDAIVAAVPGVTAAADVTATHLAAIASLNLRNKDISALKSGDFSGLSSMTSLNLYGNMLSSLPNGIFAGLTSLTSLRLGGNTVSPMPLIVWLEQVSNDMYKVSIPAGAPFDVAVPVVLVDGVLRETLRTVTISKGSVKSDAFWVPVVQSGSIVIGALPNLPSNHFGYVLTKSGACNLTPQVAAAITAVVPGVTDCRNLSETDLATIASLNLNNKSITSLRSDDFAALLSLTSLDLRNNQLSSLPDGIFSGLTGLTTLQLSGNTVDPILLTVSLEKVGTNMVRATLPTGAPFDLVLPISLANGSLAGNASSVTISTGRVRSTALLVTRTTNTTGAVTANIGTLPSIPATHNGYTLTKSTALPLEIFRRINVAPVFTAGTTTTRSIAENTAADTNIGSAISATDANSGDTLTYTLSGADASSFSIVSTSGQLRTKAALDYETKSSYTVTITVSDGSLTDSITVTINITDVDENRAPVFTAGTTTTRSIAENTAADTNIGSAISATDANSGDTLTYTLSGADASSFSIVSTSGQLQAKAALDYETKSSYTVTITVSDSTATDSITVTINVTDVDENRAPVFTAGTTTTRSIAENTAADTNIGTTVSATDADSDTLTYSLGETDAASFSIVSTSGQLQTKSALNYERKSSYTVTVSVSDGNGGSDTITVTITITDVVENVAPVFTDGATTTRSIAENTAAGTNIGSPVAATDANTSDTLTYTLTGTEAASFSIVSTSGQLQTKSALNYERKNSYTVTVSVSDGNGGSDSITVTINITNVLNEGTQQSNVNVAPVFTDGATTTRSIAENTAAGTNIGSPVAATDANTSDTLTYTLTGTEAASFSIVSTSGQLQTKSALNYERKNSYTVTVSVSDGNGGSDSITVTINITNVLNEGTQQSNVNVAPVFTDGATTTRSIAENTAAGTNIGSPVAATDANTSDTLTYTLTGTEAASFSIVSTSGQLQTKSALDYKTKTSYTVTVTVSDGNGGTDSIAVTINITNVLIETAQQQSNVNVAPVFTDGDSAIRLVEEGTPAGTNVGSPVAATDADNDTLTYSISGTDTATFRIVSTTGQLITRRETNYYVKNRYSVTVSVSDGNGGSDTIAVNIHLTNYEDVNILNNNTPFFSDLHYNEFNGVYTFVDIIDSVREFEIAENSPAETTVAEIVTIDQDRSHQHWLQDSLSGPDANSFNVDNKDVLDLSPIFLGLPIIGYSFSKITTKAPLDYETKEDYSVIVTVTDLEGATDTLAVNIKVTDVDEAPEFTDGDTTTRAIAENVSSGISIGSAVSATDPEGETLTYTLGGTDASSFSIDSSTGQLQTSADLDYETKSTYTVTVTASDGNLTETITVTINVTNLNEVVTQNAPVFSEGTSTTRSIAENTSSGTNIGSAITATDTDAGTTLVYFISGTNASSFSIVSSTGQLKTNAALDYEAKSSYTVTVTASDGNLTDTITVTINVTNANDAPIFDDGTTTTRVVGEEVDIGTNVGAPILASDQDKDILTYSLGGTDAVSFTIDSSTGQLKTGVELDFDTKRTYSVTVTVRDDDTSNSLTDTITVTININKNFLTAGVAPDFSERGSITRSVAENTAAGTNIGAPITATDADSDEITYSLLDASDSASFDIDSTNGQLKTKADLDFETKNAYTVSVLAIDDSPRALWASTNVRINVTDVNDNPVFTAGSSTTLAIAENTSADQNIGSPITATDDDEDTITYMLGGTDAASFSVVSTSGQIKTKVDLDYETKSSYTVTLTASDGNGGTSPITVTINVTDVEEQANAAPMFTAGDTATRSIAENVAVGTNVGAAFTATDSDNDTLTYSLSGTDAASFTVDNSTGQLKTNATFDYETKISYTVIITAADGKPNNGKDTITVTINITDVTENSAPVFTDGDSTTRSIDETDYAGTSVDTWVNIGSLIAATDADNDTLTYTITGTPANFQMLATGQLQGKGLDHETAASHSLTLTVSDTNSRIDSISVTVTVNDINEVPTFSSDAATTLTVQNGTAASTNIGSAYTAYDFDDGDTITFSLAGTDAISFQLGSSSTQDYTESFPAYSVFATVNIQTKDSLDYAKNSYSVDVVATDAAGLTKTTSITINVVKVPDPVVSSRSAAVRDAIVAAVSGVDSASNIDGTHLEGITSLDLSSSSISSLSTGDFNGLTFLVTLDLSGNTISSLPSDIFSDLGSLTSLNLSGNQLPTDLPDGLFSGLSLDTLDLSGNTGNPTIVLSIEKVTHSENDALNQYYRVKVNTGAPFGFTLELHTYSFGFNTQFGPLVPISAGSIYSDNLKTTTVVLNGFVVSLGLEIVSPGDITLPDGHSGYTFRNSDDQPFELIPVGFGAPSQVGNADSQLPQTTELLSNFPNPFNPETWIPYQLAKPSDVSITIYDIRGNVVRQLDIGHQKVGFYTSRSRAAYWDGRNAVGERVANGVYFYLLKAGDYAATRKMLILK